MRNIALYVKDILQYMRESKGCLQREEKKATVILSPVLSLTKDAARRKKRNRHPERRERFVRPQSKDVPSLSGLPSLPRPFRGLRTRFPAADCYSFERIYG